MDPLETLKVYAGWARELSDYWGRPYAATLSRMLLSRLFFGRGPKEFDQFRFATRPLRQWREFVVDREREALQERASPAESRYLDEDKVQFWKRCVDHGLPTVPVTALVGRGQPVVAPQGAPVAQNVEDLERILLPMGNFAGFAKPIGAGQGYGAFPFDLQGQAVVTPDGRGDVGWFFDYLASLKINKHGYLLQPRMQAHPDLLGVMPGPGLGSIRLLTFLGRDGALDLPWAHLKVPGRGEHVSYSHDVGLIAPIDLKTGRLGTAVGRAGELAVTRPFERHPETGVRFEDVVIPEWDSIVSMVQAGTRAFQALPCLGWDVVVTTEGPLLLETNWGFGIHSTETILNRGLRRELREKLENCMRDVQAHRSS